MEDLNVSMIVLLYGVLLVSLVCHEASHALFALLGGDRTAYLGGQVTLNPVPHIQREPFGTVILPLIGLFMSNGTMCFGYAHAPYDPIWAYHHPKRAALMSAAGPLANIALVIIACLVMYGLILADVAVARHGDFPLGLIKPADGSESGAVWAVIRIASTFVLLNVLLALINLMPLPPFDGAGIVEGLFPRTAAFYGMVRNQFLVVIGMLIVLMQTVEYWFWPVVWTIKDIF